MLAKSKLNRIESLVSKALINMNISHEENVKVKEKMKENVRNISEKLE